MRLIDPISKKVASNKIYTNRLEMKCIQQFNDCLSQDSVLHGALMPDSHTGYTAPIGSAFITRDYLYPSWVGYDIGCGILSIPTSFKKEDVIENGMAIFKDIHWDSSITNVRTNPCKVPKLLKEYDLSPLGQSVWELDNCHGFEQLGTLGGGNHFIEIGVDLKDKVWITIHSGSRGVGHLIAYAHIKLALRAVHTEGNHPRFLTGGLSAGEYLNDMTWLQNFASLNRHMIADTVANIMKKRICGGMYLSGKIQSDHNHIEVENNLYIHRKGCTQADKGVLVNIASNMRDGVYLCKGKGVHESIYSCSHGAGRACSRSEAKKRLDTKTFDKDMKGVICNSGSKYIDEAPRAYKNISTVMESQSDLINVINHIRPLINIKNTP